MEEYIVVLVTVSSQEEAKKITGVLLNNKLAACVNIIDKVSSSYWWEGKIESSDELLLIIKTRKDLIESLIKKVKENHSYTVPEIIALPIIAGNQDYLSWIKENTC